MPNRKRGATAVVTVANRNAVVVVHLVCEQRDETLRFSLQVQVHVEQLPVESLVNLLLALRPAGLLHGPLHTLPVQVARQVTQENADVLHVVQGYAELAESQEEPERRNKRRKRCRATEKWTDGWA